MGFVQMTGYIKLCACVVTVLMLPTPLVWAQVADRGIETGSISKEVIVKPVRRVFPKTPSDKELSRLSTTSVSKAKSKTKNQNKTQ